MRYIYSFLPCVYVCLFVCFTWLGFSLAAAWAEEGTKLVELSMPFKERCQKKKISFVGVFLLFGWFGFPCWFVFKCRVNSFVVFKVCVV